ncbi:hypothetical protein M011DRAFT_337455 [Sporormia fimetaria CBS 119925]|uniref:Uncharacterized protein n=1 Tax=Sporormia fimetaria CBS 119925 TaxID=1340428 RepID=A0A6A6VEV8_9PLEO|nr:hypothetical protein M011DRAFT_337455 [Sporormia fimetaria CBS 119925]
MGIGLNISVVFQPNRHFQMDGGVGIDKMWAEMMPLGRGFVQVDTEGKAIEYDGEKHGLEDTKVVAVFHQLHCLNNLRKSLFAAVDDYENFRYLAPSFKHEWKYCFDYLRQSLMCSADVTLEELEKSRDSDRKLASADGWGTRHVCRDFGRLFEWAERNRGSDDGGID